jgi:hypothetical protein
MWFKNTNKDKNVYLLLDRSGSMATEWPATINSINEYVKKLEDDVNVYIAAFDSGGSANNYTGWNIATIDFSEVRKTTAKAFEPITIYEISPRGGTPLFDAAGRIMNQMLQDNPERAVLVIMTDGEENTSREFNRDRVMGMIKLLEEKKWPVVYLGAGFKEVETYAISTFNMASTNTFNTTAGTRGAAMASVGAKSMAYFNSTDTVTMDAAMLYTDEEKAQFNGENREAKTSDKS